LGVEFAYLLLLMRSPEARRLLLAGIVGAMTIIPWIAVLLLDSGSREMAKSLSWNLRPTVMDVVFYVVGIFGWLATPGLTPVLLLFVAAALVMVVLRWRAVNWPVMSLVVALAAVPPIALFLVSHYAPGSVWAPRQLIGSAIFLVMIIGYGVTLHRPRWLAATLGLVLIAWSAVALRGAPTTRIPWRDVVRSIDRNCADCLIASQEGMFVVPLRYYSNREVIDVRTGLRFSNTGSPYPYDASVGAGQVDIEGTKRIIFVCREPKCVNLDRLTGRYQVVVSGTIDWSNSHQAVKVFELARID
jgi:hypothetical protein